MTVQIHSARQIPVEVLSHDCELCGGAGQQDFRFCASCGGAAARTHKLHRGRLVPLLLIDRHHCEACNSTGFSRYGVACDCTAQAVYRRVLSRYRYCLDMADSVGPDNIVWGSRIGFTRPHQEYCADVALTLRTAATANTLGRLFLARGLYPWEDTCASF